MCGFLVSFGSLLRFMLGCYVSWVVWCWLTMRDCNSCGSAGGVYLVGCGGYLRDVLVLG